MKRIGYVSLLLIFLWPAQSLAAVDYYVAANGSDGNPGTQAEPWRTIGKANASLQPGDRVFIRSGTYSESIAPSRSGSPGQYITYQNYGNETVTITGISVAVDLPQRNYIKVDGIRIIDVGCFVEIVSGNRNIVSNCHMDGADQFWGSVRILNGASYNKILNNTISHGNGDTVFIYSEDPYPGSNANLIQGNEIDSMGSTHGAIAIRTIYSTNDPPGGPFAGESDCMYNVVRGNHIHHADDDCVMGCEYSRRNVYEDNTVTLAGYEGDHDIGTGLKFLSSYNIIRHNKVYYNPSAGLGLRSQIRQDRHVPNMHNRVYHNVFYNNGNCGHGVNYASGGQYIFGYGNEPDEAEPVEDNIIVNNIFAENVPYHLRIDPDIPTERVMFDNAFENNIFYPAEEIRFLGVDYSLQYMESHSFQQVIFKNNVEGNPGFADASRNDFSLTASSAAIDKGRFLTQTRTTGSGNVIPVEDASFFMDGFGIVQGDLIQLQGEQSTSQITDINYSTNVITVDRNLSWQAGQGVSLPYNGSAPDSGAHEWGGTSSLSAYAGASLYSGQAPLTVQFEGGASGGDSPYTYRWTFGDGSSSTQQNPSHTYNQAGTFTATLTVTDDLGSQDSDTVTITVHSIQPLSAGVVASPTSGSSPLDVFFTGTVSGGSSPYTYRWTFGDGDSSTQKDPSHTYSSPGSYTATFTVTDGAGQQSSASVVIAVSQTNPGSARLCLSMSTGQPAGGQGGTITPSTGTHVYPFGSDVQIKAKPNQGYRFAKWAGDVYGDKAGRKNITITLNRDKSLNAIFCSMCGDVNGDLRLSPLDSQAVFDIFLGRNDNPTLCQKENGDVNGDGTKADPYISPADAQAIFVKYLGKGELPCDCSYEVRTAASFTPGVLGEMVAAPAPSQEIHLGLDELRKVSDTEIHLPVMINNPQNIDAFGFDLVYPAEFLEFTGLAKTEMVKDFYQVEANPTAQGMLRVGGYSVDPIMNPEGGELVLLIFKLTKKGVNGAANLYINETFDDVANAYYVKPEKSHGAQKSKNYVRR